jgi:SAM-dependent methyltransferase
MTEPEFHRGLVALTWESIEGGPEIDYFGRIIAERGGTALDAGCGSGRLLRPWLARGLAVEGVEPSADMLAICRRKAEAGGLRPILYQQPLHELEIGRTYRSMVVCGAFGIGTSRQQDREGLRRLFGHLEPGGLLMVDVELPWASPRLWERWVPRRRRHRSGWGNPEETILDDGSRLMSYDGPVEIDPIEQLMTARPKFELWRGDRLIQADEPTLRFRWYFPHELALLLETVGFEVGGMTGDYTDEPLTATHRFVVLFALRPA